MDGQNSPLVRAVAPARCLPHAVRNRHVLSDTSPRPLHRSETAGAQGLACVNLTSLALPDLIAALSCFGDTDTASSFTATTHSIFVWLGAVNAEHSQRVNIGSIDNAQRLAIV